jgi:hypothetical protein
MDPGKKSPPAFSFTPWGDLALAEQFFSTCPKYITTSSKRKVQVKKLRANFFFPSKSPGGITSTVETHGPPTRSPECRGFYGTFLKLHLKPSTPPRECLHSPD